MVLHNIHQIIFSLIEFKQRRCHSHQLSNILVHTLKGKNIKFTHVAKKKMSSETELFTQVNSETDMFENLSKYITPNELNQFG